MTSKESAKKAISKLVAQFKEHEASYKQSEYNETQTRREFIDPFFTALGWDVDNKGGLSPSYKEVQHEDRVKVEEKLKSPDYSFRLNGKRYFFVEAKKPSVNLKDDVEPAYQVRRYAWSANLKLSIVTDFEEFAYYDCTTKPNQTDKASKSRLNYFKYTDYIEKFDEIWNLFSKESVENGSYDNYLKSEKKKGKNSVDDDFLESLLKWRDLLAKDIFKQNKNISEDHLNYVVQNTIDRIIFLRIAEDRYIEPYGTVKKTLETKDTYSALFELFKKADEKYNSGLFNFEKDKISKNVIISNKCLAEIIENLYFPNSPYEFSVIPVEILGSAYEQFLGKTIQVKNSKILIEEKPEVRKAGGVYYTPQYIVDYIVQNTVGKLIENKAPKDIEKIKILDPASGSGSFLLGAYDYLLKYHLDWYSKNSSKSKGKKNDPLNPDGSLTTEVKKKILLNNIYGVDIDANAVEVTKLSLLLKCLEGETEASIKQQMTFFNERVLPTLDNNIKCGNSLVDTDFYEIEFDHEVLKKVKPFNWEIEFKDVFKQGGFDAVIGNPPYVYMHDEISHSYFDKKYQHQNYQQDLYLIFLEKYQYFLKLNGVFGVIVSNSWLQSILLKNIRKYLLKSYTWLKVLHLPEKVFKAIVDTHVLVFKKSEPKNTHEIDIEMYKKGVFQNKHKLLQNELPNDGQPINIIVSQNSKAVYQKIKNGSYPLNSFCSVFNGVKPFEKGKGSPPQTRKIMQEKPFVKIDCKKPSKDWSPLLRGSLISRYKNIWDNNSWILYGKWLAAPREESIFKAPEKIMVRQTGDSIIATFIEAGFIARNNLHIILINNHKLLSYNYLLGILNSKLIDCYYTYINPEKGEALAEVKKKHIEILPIIPLSEDESKKQAQKKIEQCVKNILKLNKSANPDQNQIKHYENQIDKLVYELYGLTEDEIKIIEEAVNGNS